MFADIEKYGDESLAWNITPCWRQLYESGKCSRSYPRGEKNRTPIILQSLSGASGTFSCTRRGGGG